MSYLVLARKWRPKTFTEVVGQQHVLQALINGLNQNRLHHAFLFAGTRGVGKTTLARILAKSLNCEQGVSATPCGQCSSCQEVDNGRFVDLIEVDAASRTKVDDTRELLDNVQYAPSRGRYKVYLIDEVHMLSASSFNALLKTLEEPPPHVKFLFATTDPQKLPVTILSRCLQFNLRRLSIVQIADHLAYLLGEENIEFEAEALQQLAHAADGSMRDALSLLDQAIGYTDGKISTDAVQNMLGSITGQQVSAMLAALADHDAQLLLQQVADLTELGRDMVATLNALLSALQQIATLQLLPDTATDQHPEQQSFSQFADSFSPEVIQLLYQIALHGKRDLPYAVDVRSGVEMTLLRMLSFQPRPAENHSKKKPEKPKIASTKPKTAVADPVVEQISVPDPVSPATPSPEKTTTPEKPVSVKKASKIAEADSHASQPLSIRPESWTPLVAELKLSAITRQLAEHCAFVSAHNDQIKLLLSTELAHLATDNAKTRLQSALSKKLQQSVNLIFDTSGTPQTQPQTLAAERAEQAMNKQAEASAAIHNDPVVEVIKSTFNARIIDSTIKPLN